MSRRFLTYLMALATVTLWGASFPLTKVALEALGPTSLAFLRWTISAIVLTAWLGWGERDRNRIKENAHRSRAFRRFLPSRGRPAEASSPDPQAAIFRTDATCGVGCTRANENGRRSLLRSGASPGVRIFRTDAQAASDATGNRNATPAELRYRATTGARIRSLLRQDPFPVLWVSLSGITLFYWLENTALQFTTATNAGVLSNLTSVFMVLIAVAFLRERLGWLEWLAMAVAFGGAVLVSQGAGHLTLSGDGWIGDLMMVVASLFAAIYSIGGKRLSEKYSAAVVITVVAAVGAAFLLPLALVEGLYLNLPLRVWGVILLLGVGSGALANAWWLVILARMDASRAALALFLIPVIAASLSVLLLGEPLTPTIVLGGILVLGGVMAVQRKVADEM